MNYENEQERREYIDYLKAQGFRERAEQLEKEDEEKKSREIVDEYQDRMAWVYD